MIRLHRDFAFWVAIAAVVLHSLNAAIFTGFGFMMWLFGDLAIVILYYMAKGRVPSERSDP